MIHCENLYFGYTSYKLFKDLNFDIPKGCIVGLLGKNGEGKTTLMKLISGQLMPSRGELTTLGENPKDRNPSFLEQIFLVPEIVKVPNIKIKEYFERVSAFYQSYDKDLAYKVLEIFGINDQMKLNQISQGQQKKAVLTLAIAIKPKLLLMDEPTNGLDIPSKAAFRQILSEYISEDQTIIISTHQVRDLDQLIDRILILEQNSIVINEDIHTLSKSFDFIRVSEAEQREPIYTEGGALGQVGVYPSQDNLELTDFSIELFFNAMISNPEKMKEIIASRETKN